jgi:hypothetical protein
VITEISMHPFPNVEEASDDFLVKINGSPIFVHKARVSAFPMCQEWKGYQRPLEQTELASFAYWDMSQPVIVEISSRRPLKSVTIRPSSYGIKHEADGDRISFELDRPRQIVVEVNGSSCALHLFANPVEEFAVNKQDPLVKYFGPGIHHAGIIELKDNETLYIESGAVVHGLVQAWAATNIRILGRGILDSSGFERTLTLEQSAEDYLVGALFLYQCNQVEINGIILRDPRCFAVVPINCRHVHIHNIKLIGLWRYNTDGIDIVNCQHVKIEKSFIRTFDDSIVIKGLKYNPLAGKFPDSDEQNIYDIYIKDCVIWNDWGSALEIGAETRVNEISNITYKDCDIIHATDVACRIHNSDRALVKDVRYENIHVEFDQPMLKPVIQQTKDEKYDMEKDDYCPRLFAFVIGKRRYSLDEERGKILNVLAKDISVTCKSLPDSTMFGYDESHKVENVVFDNVRINAKKVQHANESGFKIGDFSNLITFI